MRATRRQFLVVLGLAPFIPSLRLKPNTGGVKVYTNKNGWRIIDIDWRIAPSAAQRAKKFMSPERWSREFGGNWNA